jgi:hypothetical protein
MTARDVTPKPGQIAPPPMPHQMQQNQKVSKGAPRDADGNSRTE